MYGEFNNIFMTSVKNTTRKTNLLNKSIEDVCNIEPFVEQRDIDKSRLKDITKIMKQNLKKYNNVQLDVPIILIECSNFGSFLLNKSNERTHSVIVDGQHRVAALRLIINSKDSGKIKNTEVPVMIHTVQTLNDAREIQFNIFEQKPVNDYDKIQRKSYKLVDVIDKFVMHYRKTHKDIVRKCFSEGKYGDKGRKFRKYHFLFEELTDKIKSSANIGIWVEREIQYNELDNAIGKVIASCLSKLKSMKTKKEQMRFVNITTESNFSLFENYLKSMPFQIIPYVYYKKYDNLVNDIEKELLIFEEDDDEFEDSSEEDDEEAFQECD